MEWRIEKYVAELDSSFSELLNIANHKTYAVSQSVAGGIFIRDVYQLGINFDPLHAQAQRPPDERIAERSEDEVQRRDHGRSIPAEPCPVPGTGRA